MKMAQKIQTTFILKFKKMGAIIALLDVQHNISVNNLQNAVQCFMTLNTLHNIGYDDWMIGSPGVADLLNLLSR